jgi:hypothetical protein
MPTPDEELSVGASGAVSVGGRVGRTAVGAGDLVRLGVAVAVGEAVAVDAAVGVRVKFSVVAEPAVTVTLFTVEGLKPAAEAVTL